ncbi:unnamed protein product [Cochlearia groenlandica]
MKEMANKVAKPAVAGVAKPAVAGVAKPAVTVLHRKEDVKATTTTVQVESAPSSEKVEEQTIIKNRTIPEKRGGVLTAKSAPVEKSTSLMILAIEKNSTLLNGSDLKRVEAQVKKSNGLFGKPNALALAGPLDATSSEKKKKGYTAALHARKKIVNTLARNGKMIKASRLTLSDFPQWKSPALRNRARSRKIFEEFKGTGGRGTTGEGVE